MRRFLSLLSLSFFVAIMSGCCLRQHCCDPCGGGHHRGCCLSGTGHHVGTHGVCDCDLLDPCYQCAPWAMMMFHGGEIPVSHAEEIKSAPKVDKK